MAIVQKGEKMPERRLTRAGKLTRILIINGECLKDDLLELIGSMSSIDTLLSRHSDEFAKIVKQAELEDKEKADDIHFDKLVIIRPKVTYKKIEASPFKKLVYKLDPSGAAWTYYDEKVFRVGKVRARNRTIYRNTTISHFLIRIMDIFDIDVWARPTIQELCADDEYIPVNTFFTVNELKNFSKKGNREHCNSVSLGILTTPQGVYSAYSMKSAPEESYWNIVQKKKKKTRRDEGDDEKTKIPGYMVGVEERFQRHVTNVFKTGKYEYSSGSHNNIMILGTKDIAVSICKGFYYPNSKRVIRLPKSAEKVTFLTDDQSSKEVLTLLSIPNMREKIRDEVAANIDGVWENRQSKTEDAVMGGMDTLIWMDNDIRRLSRALNKTDRSPKQLRIVCLDSQKNLVEEIVEIYRNKEIEVFTAPIKYETALSMATKEREVIDDA